MQPETVLNCQTRVMKENEENAKCEAENKA